MSDWYGLYEDDELVAVMEWWGKYPPCILDFGAPISSDYEYEVLKVDVIPRRRSW